MLMAMTSTVGSATDHAWPPAIKLNNGYTPLTTPVVIYNTFASPHLRRYAYKQFFSFIVRLFSFAYTCQW